MGKPDDGLRALFRKHLPGPAHWQTIEHLLDRGTPDSNVCLSTPLMCDDGTAMGYAGTEIWIEYKSVKCGWAVSIRPEQVAWALRRTRMGGRVVIAIRRRVIKDGCDDLYLVPGAMTRELKDHGIKSGFLVQSIGRWSGGPRHWNWAEVREALLLPG